MDCQQHVFERYPPTAPSGHADLRYPFDFGKETRAIKYRSCTACAQA